MQLLDVAGIANVDPPDRVEVRVTIRFRAEVVSVEPHPLHIFLRAAVVRCGHVPVGQADLAERVP